MYLLKCLDCNKPFKTNNKKLKVCPECLKYRKPHRKTSTPKKILTFADISHIGDVYYKINHKYLHYGDIVNLIHNNAEHCVCCGTTIPEDKQICPQCESAAK
jgi:predicted amidophosphoribosyltransferase